MTRPADTRESLRNAIASGKARQVNIDLMKRAELYNCRIDAAALLERLDGADDLTSKKQILKEFWDSEEARVQRLLGAALGVVKSQNKNTDPLWRKAVSILEESVKQDLNRPSGLSVTAEATTKRAATALTDAMADEVKQGTLNQDLVELYIGGGKGISVACHAAY